MIRLPEVLSEKAAELDSVTGTGMRKLPEVLRVYDAEVDSVTGTGMM